MATKHIARGGPGQAGLGQNQKYAIHPGLATSGDMSKQQQLEWLKRSRLWPTMQANHYIGKRVLGAGSHGIVGVWQREQRSQDLPKLIVVKQVNAWFAGDQLRVESKLLRDLVGTGSEHVVALYRSYYRDGGSGTEAERDPLPFDANHVWRNNLEVGRLYMEYCQYGSLESALENIFEDPDAVIPEEYIWRLLRCLACALAALKHGSESSDHAAPSWNQTMVHFDIKPANILMSSHGNNHPRLPIFKLADFGLGLPLPQEIFTLNAWLASTPAFRAHWRDDTIWRGTPGYTPPEQIWPGVDHGRIGLCSDVWSLGVILYELMTGKIFQTVRVVGAQQGLANVTANEFTQHMFLRVPQNNAQPPFSTFGQDIIHRPYSKRLIYLTHQCLAIDPQRRPSPRALLRAANRMMEDVYRQPVRSLKKTVLDNRAIRSARRFDHNLLARLSHTDINAFNGLHRLIRIQPAQPFGVPLWPVLPESGANNLPNFAPSQPLQANQNINQYPWRNTVPGGRPQPPAVETRLRKRVAERSRRRLTGS